MYFSRGPGTEKISAKLFAENRSRLVNALKDSCKRSTFVLLKGGSEPERYNCDSDDYVFRQESFFFWTFGVHECDFLGAIDTASGQSILFAPRLSPDYAIWHGKIEGAEWFRTKYGVDEVIMYDEDTIAETLKKRGAKHLLLLEHKSSDSGRVLKPACFKGIDGFKVNTDTLSPIITNLRVFKTDSELEVIRYACKTSAEAHKAAMMVVKPGMYQFQLESVILHSCYFYGGCRHMAYTPILASGANCGVLDYGHENAPNDQEIKDGEMCLFDVGAEYNCYASDITTSFPANGVFTEKQKIVYRAVLKANHEVFENAKPGVTWTDMHMTAERVILSELKDAGIVRGNVEDMMEVRLGAVFMPHGLGHFMGLDDHDVGGYIADASPRSTEPGLKCLRTTRTLQERMVITIEPGCYFIDVLLDAALANPEQKKFINAGKLEEYRGFGGVRIEDNVVIWANKNENMTVDVPRTVAEIEIFMRDNKH